MVHAERKLAPEIHMLCLEESSIDLVMNVPGNYVRKNEEIRENLIRQITHPVRWEQSIQAMKHADLFIEIGCGKTLAGLNRQMSVAQTISINKNSDLEVLAQILG
jgi:[acyl-carrier-protein] S-malonyltransferase